MIRFRAGKLQRVGRMPSGISESSSPSSPTCRQRSR